MTMATVIGTNIADPLQGTNANDIILGLGGDDIITGHAGADYLNGGQGFDRASYLQSSTGVSVSLESGTGFGGTAEGDVLDNIEGLYGSHYNDTLTGDAGSNRFDGFDGDDLLKGGGGADELLGHGDDDTQGRRRRRQARRRRGNRHGLLQ